MARLLIFGLGYSGARIAAAARGRGWAVEGTGRHGTLAFDDAPAVLRALARATCVLSSVPPGRDGADPVLARYGAALAQAQAQAQAGLVYLSSTGVYGDVNGAWVDESAALVGAGATGRRTARATCDAAWRERGARVLRLPGIYGPGRSALDRVAAGGAVRVDLPGQVFSRVHVDDLARGALAALDAPPGAYNLADDEPASQNAVIEEACRLLGRAPPPLVPLDEAGLSPMARGFYAENRRVANGRARRVLGWTPVYATFRAGLRAVLSDSAISSPDSASTTPSAASQVQR